MQEDSGDPDWENEAEFEDAVDDDPEYDPEHDELPEGASRWIRVVLQDGYDYIHCYKLNLNPGLFLNS